MTLFGRTSEIEALRACAAVCVIAGDAGAGKSALLREIQLLTDGAAPAPVQLAERPGSLQQGLLEAMAGALADLNIAEGPLARAQRLAGATAQRLIDGRLQSLANAAGRIMRSYAIAHLGQDAVDAAGEVADALHESQSQELERRITSSGEADVMAVIAALVHELADIAGSTRVVLALDDLHQLPDEDLRRFRDFMSEIDGAVTLRATFTVTTAADQATLDQIASKGAQVVQLSGLHPEAVQEWVLSSGADPARTGEIERTTGGLPLYVGDAIALIGFGLPLDGLSGNKVLRARTRAAWSSLSATDQSHAVLLACLPTHPSPKP